MGEQAQCWKCGTPLDPDLLPPELEFAGPARPRFEWRDTDYWAQGIRVGLEGVW